MVKLVRVWVPVPIETPTHVAGHRFSQVRVWVDFFYLQITHDSHY